MWSGNLNVVGQCTFALSNFSLTPISNAVLTKQPPNSTRKYYSTMPSYSICEGSSAHIVSLDGRGETSFDVFRLPTTYVNSIRLVKVYSPSYCPASGRCVYKTSTDATRHLSMTSYKITNMSLAD